MRNSFTGNANFRACLFSVVITLIYGFGFIFSEFYGSPFNQLSDFFVLVAQWLVVVVACFGLLHAMMLNRYVFALVFPSLTLICTILAYFRYTANVALTPMVIELAFVNDVRTCMDVFSWQLVVYLVFALALSLYVVRYRWKHVRLSRWYLHALAAFVLIMLANSWVSTFKRPVSERMPYSVYYNIARYFEEKHIAAEQRTTFDKLPVYCKEDTLTVVMVVGESLRADHLQLNGYRRHTTPLLAKDTAVISYPSIYTEPCYTHTSVPRILTRADSLHPERAYNEQSFVTLFKRAGFHTSWIANQESVDTYVYFMNECDTLIYANRGKSLYQFGKWMDGDLLPHYNRELQKSDSPKKLVILHTIGSHWWYNARYPDAYRKFVPVISSRVVSSCTQEEMVNSYDNTILYSDYVVNEFLKSLRHQKAILFFLSDHGEALGENGNFLHAADYPSLHYPASFVWYSPLYSARHPEKIRRLKDNRYKTYSTDYLFHSILDAAGIHCDAVDLKQSIMR